jgi:uncharacterized protein (TIGR00297 family)
MTPLPVALSAAALGAALAWRARWLTAGGAVAATAVAAAVLAGGGWSWGATLAVFAASGSLLARVGRHRKTQPEHAGAGRAAGQVLATGGLAAAAGAAVVVAGPEATLASYAAPVFFGSLAAVTADTWATELGMLSAQPPVLITSGRPVHPGTSGGVTAAGTAAGVAGAATIGLCALLATPTPRLFAAVALAGVVGMMADSLLGATLQAIFAAPGGGTTETPGRARRRVRGVRWLTNPAVNLVAAAAGAAVAALFAPR